MSTPWRRWPRRRRWAAATTGAITATLALASVMAGASVLAGPDARPAVVARCDARTLGTLGGLFGNAVAVNRHGTAVGIADDAQGVAQPVMWRDSTPDRLDTGLARSIPLAVNAAGQVIGTGVPPGADSPRGWVWSQGRTTRLGVRDHRIARPEAINDRGVVVGALSPDEGSSEEASEGAGEDENDWAAMWPSPSSRPVVLRPLQGDQGAHAFAVDGDGRVGGISQGATTRPVIWDGSEHPRALPTLGGGYGIVRALGDNGVAVGDAVRADGADHAVQWDAAGRITDLGLPAGARSAKAEAVLPSGTVVGTAEVPSAGGWYTQAVQWTAPGAVQVLPSATGAAANAAQAVTVAGYRADGAGGRHPTLWRCGR
jgi:uncharacterized membrane protein